MKKLNFKIILIVCILLGVATLGTYFMVNFKKVLGIIKEKERASTKLLRGDVKVIVKNIGTKDRRFCWVQACISWKIDEPLEATRFPKKEQLVYYLDTYLTGLGDSAITLSLLGGKTSLDIINDKRKIEEDIKQRIKKNLKSFVIDKEIIDITRVKIERLRFFDEPRKEKDFPPEPTWKGSRPYKKPILTREEGMFMDKDGRTFKGVRYPNTEDSSSE